MPASEANSPPEATAPCVPRTACRAGRSNSLCCAIRQDNAPRSAKAAKRGSKRKQEHGRSAARNEGACPFRVLREFLKGARRSRDLIAATNWTHYRRDVRRPAQPTPYNNESNWLRL